MRAPGHRRRFRWRHGRVHRGRAPVRAGASIDGARLLAPLGPRTLRDFPAFEGTPVECIPLELDAAIGRTVRDVVCENAAEYVAASIASCVWGGQLGGAALGSISSRSGSLSSAPSDRRGPAPTRAPRAAPT